MSRLSAMHRTGSGHKVTGDRHMSAQRLMVRVLCVIIGLWTTVQSSPAQTNGENRSVQLWATVTSSPASITLNWKSHPNTTGFTVFRKLKGGTSWGSSIASLGSTATQYVDNGVQANTSYEYKVVRTTSNLGSGYGYVNAGIQLEMVEFRGKVVLVVDNTFTGSLSAQLTQLQNDLEGEGWKVVRHDVSRTAAVTAVKSLIPGDLRGRPHEREGCAAGGACSRSTQRRAGARRA